jgi:CBS domain-containing protein
VVIADADATALDDPPRMERSADTSGEKSTHPARVADAMHCGLVQCTPDATLREVASLMTDAVVHCVVVVEAPGDRAALWGVVTDLDLVAAATVRSLDDQRAGGTAMTPAITAFPHESLGTAAERMTTHGVSHLVVVDDVRGRPVGVVSTLDLVRSLTRVQHSNGGRSHDGHIGSRRPRVQARDDPGGR